MIYNEIVFFKLTDEGIVTKETVQGFMDEMIPGKNDTKVLIC